MFATYQLFKSPIQREEYITLWQGVELMPKTSLLIATLEHIEDTSRTYLLNGTADLVEFIKRPGLATLTELILLLPPGWASSNDWTFVPVCRVERELKGVVGVVGSGVLMSRDGQRYGGFPIRPMERDGSGLEVLADLPNSAT